MKTSTVMLVTVVALAPFVVGCATNATTRQGGAGQDSARADAVIHISGLSCPF